MNAKVLRLTNTNKIRQEIAPVFYELNSNCMKSFSSPDQDLIKTVLKMDWECTNNGKCGLTQYHRKDILKNGEKVVSGRVEKEFTVKYKSIYM